MSDNKIITPRNINCSNYTECINNTCGTGCSCECFQEFYIKKIINPVILQCNQRMTVTITITANQNIPAGIDLVDNVENFVQNIQISSTTLGTATVSESLSSKKIDWSIPPLTEGTTATLVYTVAPNLQNVGSSNANVNNNVIISSTNPRFNRTFQPKNDKFQIVGCCVVPSKCTCVDCGTLSLNTAQPLDSKDISIKAPPNNITLYVSLVIDDVCVGKDLAIAVIIYYQSEVKCAQVFTETVPTNCNPGNCGNLAITDICFNFTTTETNCTSMVLHVEAFANYYNIPISNFKIT